MKTIPKVRIERKRVHHTRTISLRTLFLFSFRSVVHNYYYCYYDYLYILLVSRYISSKSSSVEPKENRGKAILIHSYVVRDERVKRTNRRGGIKREEEFSLNCVDIIGFSGRSLSDSTVRRFDHRKRERKRNL